MESESGRLVEADGGQQWQRRGWRFGRTRASCEEERERAAELAGDCAARYNGAGEEVAPIGAGGPDADGARPRESPVGRRLRLAGLLGRRSGAKSPAESQNSAGRDDQGLLAERAREKASSSGQTGERAPVAKAGRPGGALASGGGGQTKSCASGLAELAGRAPGPDNNGAGRKVPGNNAAGGRVAGAAGDDEADCAILFRQYLPSRSFNLGDHTPRESNKESATEAQVAGDLRSRLAAGSGGWPAAAAASWLAAGDADASANFARSDRRNAASDAPDDCQAGAAGSTGRLERNGGERAASDDASGLAAQLQPRCPSQRPSSSLAKSIADAWSRLKISPSRNRRNHRSSAPATYCGRLESSLLNDHDRQADERQQQQRPWLASGRPTGASGVTSASSSSGLGEQRLWRRGEEGAKQSVLEIRRRELEVLKLRQQLEQRPPRAAAGEGAASAVLASERAAFSPCARADVLPGGQRQQRLAAPARGRRRDSAAAKLSVDLNNNSNNECAGFNRRISNYASQLRRGSSDTNCLLEEDEEANEEAEEAEQSAIVAAQAEDLEEPKMLMAGLAEGRRVGRAKAARRPGGTGRTGLLLPANCRLLAAALWLLLLLAGAHLALGQVQQQQQPPPFARSQPAPATPLGPGPPIVGARGGLNGPQQQPGGSAAPATPAVGSLMANINCNKIRGHVTLTPNAEAGATVTTQITAGPPGEVYQWSIHQFPIKPGAAMCSCSPLILGSKLVDLSEMHGNLPSDQEFSVQSSLPLFGADSPLGHSLLLRGLKTGMLACATFLPTNRKSNYRAKFHAPLSGSVTIFQTSFGTSFLSHLMYSNGSRRHSTHRFDLVRSDDDIITTSLLAGQPASGDSVPVAGSARTLDQLERREHENELQACKRFSAGEPLFRNLTYQLTVSTENFGMRGRTALVLPHIAFETFSSVYVVVYSEHEPNEPIACAPLRFVKPKTAAAKLQTVGVQGSVVFSQDSPYDVTLVRVNLNFPNSDGHSYGIDELPMIIRRKSDTRVCPNIREIIYNPHHIEPSSVPPEGEATSDQYAVGDLSGKYGSLTGKASEKLTASDHNLPLFGPVSIIGRALTVYSADGVAVACSNVELTAPMTTAFATFDHGIQGQFIFRQPMNDCNGDTYVYIEVSKPTGSAAERQQAAANAQHDITPARSLDHNWHIHTHPVDSGLEHLSSTECSAAGAHFNPYNTSTASIYSRDCTPFNVLRCELGDLSAKMFTIEIPPFKVKAGGQELDIGKFFGTDIDLPLCGPVSIVNRSVVVHTADFGMQRLACSTVIEFKPRT